MNLKQEKLLFIISLSISLVALIIIYLVGVDIFPEPEMAEYYIRTILYLFGLVTVRGVWKLSLERRMDSKKEE